MRESRGAGIHSGEKNQSCHGHLDAAEPAHDSACSAADQLTMTGDKPACAGSSQDQDGEDEESPACAHLRHPWRLLEKPENGSGGDEHPENGVERRGRSRFRPQHNGKEKKGEFNLKEKQSNPESIPVQESTK